MTELDIDQIIDAAAEALVMHEPSRSLGAAVGRRVVEQPERRRIARWPPVAVATAAALCVLLFIVTKNPAPRQAVVGSAPDVTSAPPVVASVAPHERVLAAEGAPPRAEGIAKRAPSSDLPFEQPAEDAAFDAFESIEPDPIAIPPLNVNAARVEDILIEPVVVEPLTN